MQDADIESPFSGQCTSGPNNACQFAGSYSVEVHEHEGRYYCQAHAPLEASFKIGNADLKNLITNKLQQAGPAMNLYGVVFPAFPNQQEYNLNSADMDARCCTFGAGTILQATGNFDMFDSKCLGDFEIKYGAAVLKAKRVTFSGNATISCNGAKRLDFTGSTAEKDFSILKILADTSTRCPGLTLSFAPVIDVNTNPKVMPQDTNLRGLILRSDTAFGDGADGRYRAIRNLFNASRDREQEGTFYMYEKRARRKSLSLKNIKSWMPRAVSACYDWFAGYGQSYERAFLWFVGVQIAFALIYSCMSHRFELGGAIDSQVIAFTLAQIVKPFELLSARRADHWPYDGVYTGGSGWWTAVTMTDTVFSLTLVALFLLALRWRFRRD